MEPSLNAVIERLELPSVTGEDVAVIRVDVPRSLFVHRSPGGYLYRVGSARWVMSPEYLARLFQQRSQTRLIRFDEQIVSSARIEDLAPDFWERFRGPRSDEDRETFLCKLGLVRRDDDGVARPTVAGVLIASRDPRRWLPNAYVQTVAYRGDRVRPNATAMAYQLDAADISGPLDAQVEGACRFVARNMKVTAFKDAGRLDLPHFDMTAVFEAVVNAVVHRDYAIQGAKVRLHLFENRLELHSPGAIPNGMSVENLPWLQSARNDVVMSLLARCEVPTDVPWLDTDRRTLTDRRGEGVRLILGNSERLSGRTPEYRLVDDAELMLTIHAAGERVGGGSFG